MTKLEPDHRAFLERVGTELRDARLAADAPQRVISDRFNWGRDATSKLEKGKTDISLYNYLQLVDELQDFLPKSHPGVALMAHFEIGRARRR